MTHASVVARHTTFTCAMTGDTTFNATNITEGYTAVIKITGAFTPTFGTGFTALTNTLPYNNAKINYAMIQCIDGKAVYSLQHEV